MKEKLLQMAFAQKENLRKKPGMITRDCMPLATRLLHSDDRILVVSGMRRVGKSTLVQQLIENGEGFWYFNFEDEKLLGFTVDDFSLLEEALIEVYGTARFLFFDEIQNIDRFELPIRRLQDEGKKIVLTGSNASMLSIEFGTKLTGRYRQIELFPFSFGEYLRYRGVSYENKDFFLPESKVSFKNQFMHWLGQGGLPEYLNYNDPDYIRTLFDNILYRDIIARYGIRNQREFRELVHLLVSNLTLPVSYTSLQRNIGLSNSVTVKEYLGYLNNAYMFYEMPQYHHALKMQLRSPRKVFLADVAFHNLVGFSHSQNMGRKLENSVFLAIRRDTAEIYSYKGKAECDFVYFDKERKPGLVQVCYHLNTENQAREFAGLTEALQFFDQPAGLILTLDQEDEIRSQNKTLKVLPAWKWMLDDFKNS